MNVRANVRASIRICPDHNLYNNSWISKQFGTVVALEEEKYHLKHLCVDFEVILHSCCLRGGDVPFETFFSGRLKVKVTGVK